MTKFSKIDSQSCLTQNYWSAEPFQAKRELHTINTPNNKRYIAGISNDNFLWMYLPDDNSETATAIKKYSIVTTTTALNFDNQDNMVLLCAEANALILIREKNGKLCEPIELKTMPPIGVSRISKIFTIVVNKIMYIGILYKCEENKDYLFSYVIWDMKTSSPDFINTNLHFSSTDCSWRYDNDNFCFFGIDGNTYISYDMFNLEVVIKDIDQSVSIKKVKTAIGASYSCDVWGLDEDGKVFILIENENNNYRWQSKDLGNNIFEDIDVTYVNGIIHIAAIYDNNLYYGTYQNGTVGLSLLEKDVLNFIIDKSNSQKFNILINKPYQLSKKESKGAHKLWNAAKSSSIVNITLNDVTKDWDYSHIVIKSENHNVMEYNAYKTELIFYDEDGKIANDCPLELWSLDYTTISINNSSYNLSPENHIKVSTDISGRLHLIQQADSLNSVSLVVKKEGAEDKDAFYIKQNEPYKRYLSKITADELKNAKRYDGTLLIKDETYRDDQIIKTLSNSLNRIMSSTVSDDNICNAIGHNKYGDICQYNGETVSNYTKIPNPLAAGSFEISFENNNITYREITSKEYIENVEKRKIQSSGKKSFFSFFRNLFNAIKNGVVKVAKIIINATQAAINTTVHFIENAVEKIADFVLSTVQEVVHVAESIFLAIKTAFKDLFDWLGIIFKWDDIVKTQEYLASQLNQSIENIISVVKRQSVWITSKIEIAKTKLHSYFEELKNKIDPSINIKYDSGYNDSPYSKALSNNIIVSRITSEIKNSNIIMSSAILSDDQIANLDKILHHINSLAYGSYQCAYKSISDVVNAFGNFNLKNIFVMLIDIIENILISILNGAEIAVNIITDCLASVFDIFKTIINTRISLPLLTDLFEWILGVDMTILNIATMAIAIPFTIVYKLINNGQAPIKEGKLNEVNKKTSYIISAITSGIYYLFSSITGYLSNIFKTAKVFYGLSMAVTVVASVLWYGFSNDFSPKKWYEIVVLFIGTLSVVFDLVIFLCRYLERDIKVEGNIEEVYNKCSINSFNKDLYDKFAAGGSIIIGALSLIFGIVGVVQASSKMDYLVLFSSTLPGIMSILLGSISLSEKCKVAYRVLYVLYACVGISIIVINSILAANNTKNIKSFDLRKLVYEI